MDGEYALHLPSTDVSVKVTYSAPGYLAAEIEVSTNDQESIKVVDLQRSGEPCP
jgi:hypothetical protein